MSVLGGSADEDLSSQEMVFQQLQIFAGLAAVLVLWEATVRFYSINPFMFPTPSRVFHVALVNFDFFVRHSLVTITEIFFGFAAGLVLGFVSGVGIFYVPFLRRGFYPLLTVSAQVPKISFAPVLLIWFGAGLVTNTIITMFIVFFPVLINTIAGLQETQTGLLELCDLYDPKERFVFRYVRLPAALPLIMSSIKLDATLAVIGAIVSEFVAASSGLGFVVIDASDHLNTPKVYAAIVYITVIAVALYLIVFAIERRVLFWYQGE